MDLVTAHRLAQHIEWIHAKDRAMLTRARYNANIEYDPLAATCLGDLIYEAARTGKFGPVSRT